MGFLDSFNDGASMISGRTSRSHRHSSSRHHKKRRSRSRSRSRSSSRDRGHRRSSGRSVAGSIFGGGGNDRHDRHDKHDKHNSSRGSFFGLGGNNSRSSFFGSSRSSYYKRSPRQGFVAKSFKQVKRLWRDLVHWAKRHPWKVFFMVIVPLITGGFLTALLARFGLRIPPAIERMLNTAGKAASGGSVGLASEAVRMVSGGLGGAAASAAAGAGSSSVRVEREQRTSFGSFGGNDEPSWGGGLVDMAKKFM